jgi:EF-P beta-lysylation protein EpmB
MQHPHQPTLWRQIQRENFTRLEDLCDFLELDQEARSKLLPSARFVLNLPKRLASLMKKGDLDDPLARQFLPFSQETLKSEHFEKDPVEDTSFQLTPRLLQKYPGRALLVTTGACAMHCRYCFRQNYDYPSSSKNFDEELFLLSKREDIEEVILSGGDPLSLSDEALFGIISDLCSKTHIKRLRIHTRFPIGIPQRLDESFLEKFSKITIPVWVILHINHANELDDDLFLWLKRWQRSGALLLNQSVLLKGVNDSFEALKQLSSTLINHGILPYYLHQLDRVEGSSHYEVDPKKGTEITTQLRAYLSGYGVPLYVQEIPHQSSKTPMIQIQESSRLRLI